MKGAPGADNILLHFSRTWENKGWRSYSKSSTSHSMEGNLEKIVIVILLLKQGKPASNLTFFHHICLTSFFIKLRERILAEQLYHLVNQMDGSTSIKPDLEREGAVRARPSISLKQSRTHSTKLPTSQQHLYSLTLVNIWHCMETETDIVNAGERHSLASAISPKKHHHCKLREQPTL